MWDEASSGISFPCEQIPKSLADKNLDKMTRGPSAPPEHEYRHKQKKKQQLYTYTTGGNLFVCWSANTQTTHTLGKKKWEESDQSDISNRHWYQLCLPRWEISSHGVFVPGFPKHDTWQMLYLYHSHWKHWHMLSVRNVMNRFPWDSQWTGTLEVMCHHCLRREIHSCEVRVITHRRVFACATVKFTEV